MRKVLLRVQDQRDVLDCLLALFFLQFGRVNIEKNTAFILRSRELYEITKLICGTGI